MNENDIEHAIENIEIICETTSDCFNDEISTEIIEILRTAIYQLEKLKPKKKGLFARTAQFFKGVPK